MSQTSWDGSASWDWSADLSIPSTYAAGKSVIDQLLAALRRAGWSEHEVFGVHLAVEEAVVNAIRHGNGLDENKQGPRWLSPVRRSILGRNQRRRQRLQSGPASRPDRRRQHRVAVRPRRAARCGTS